MDFKDGFMEIPYLAKLGMGVCFPATTSCIKLDGKIIVISPGPMVEQTSDLKNIDLDLVFVAPNNFHHFHLKRMKELFPQAEFFGSLRAQRISGVDLKLLGDFEYLPTSKIMGNNLLGEYCFFHEESKNLVSTDIIFNMHHKMNLATRMATIMAGTYHKTAISRLLKVSTDDAEVFFESLENLLKFPFETLVIGHGDNLSREDFERFLKKARE